MDFHTQKTADKQMKWATSFLWRQTKKINEQGEAPGDFRPDPICTNIISREGRTQKAKRNEDQDSRNVFFQ